MDETAAFALRADREKHLATVKAIFGTSKRRARVYLAANGKRTVGDIAQALNLQRPNVSVEVKKLTEDGLLSVRSVGSQSYYYKKTIERTLGISRYLTEHFEVQPE